MKYAKPEVTALGEAGVVIEQFILKQIPRVLDFWHIKALIPAYDLDE